MNWRKKEEFEEALTKSDIMYVSSRSYEDEGCYVVELEIVSAFWGDSIEATKELCEEWDATYRSDPSIDEIVIRLKL